MHFLQVLDDGRLTDGQGRVVDFRNTVIIMTSNLGATYLNDVGQGPVTTQTRQLVMGAIVGHFPPEFINRIDEIVIFVSHHIACILGSKFLTLLCSARFPEAMCSRSWTRGSMKFKTA
jgi:hypothetical protein